MSSTKGLERAKTLRKEWERNKKFKELSKNQSESSILSNKSTRSYRVKKTVNRTTDHNGRILEVKLKNNLPAIIEETVVEQIS